MSIFSNKLKLNYKIKNYKNKLKLKWTSLLLPTQQSYLESCLFLDQLEAQMKKLQKLEKGVNPIFNGTAVSQSKKNKNRFVFDCVCVCVCV